MSQKKISIVVPVRDRCGIVERTLDSIASQTCGDFNLIIVDNGSTDATAEILGEWAERNAGKEFGVRILSEPVHGASRARNCGLNAVDTPYAMFFDSDDEMRPRHIENILKSIEWSPTAEILRWDVAILDSDGWMNVKSPSFHDELQLHLMHGSLSTQRYVAKTDIFSKAGGWNESLGAFDDWELGVRLLLAGARVRKLYGEPSVVINPTPGSLSGDSHWSKAAEISRAFAAVRGHLAGAGREVDLKLLDMREAIMAADYSREGRADLGHRLMSEVCKGKPFGWRQRLKLVNKVQKLVGKGATELALRMEGKKREKC